MSTTCEEIVLKAMGINVVGLSCVTDMAIDNEDEQLTHEEVQKVANQASEKLIKLVRNTVSRIYNG